VNLLWVLEVINGFNTAPGLDLNLTIRLTILGSSTSTEYCGLRGGRCARQLKVVLESGDGVSSNSESASSKLSGIAPAIDSVDLSGGQKLSRPANSSGGCHTPHFWVRKIRYSCGWME